MNPLLLDKAIEHQQLTRELLWQALGKGQGSPEHATATTLLAQIDALLDELTELRTAAAKMIGLIP